jgi:hypothetical protein
MGKLKIQRFSVEPVNKTIRYLQLFVTHAGSHGTVGIEIKDDFDNAFRDDMFVVKGGKPVRLPDALN